MTTEFKYVDGHRQLGMIGIARDISDENRMQNALLESKRQYDNLAAKIPVGIYVLRSKADGTFALDYVSPVMGEILGFSPECLLKDATVWFQIIHPEDLNGFVTINQEGIYLRRPFDWKGRILVGGEVRWLHIKSSPDEQDDGDILWHGIITDITEIKRADDALVNKSVELERFTYSVSHDLRSPLVTVKTFLGYLEQDMIAGNSERISEDIDFIRSAADKMELMLNELLEMSRIGRHENPSVVVTFSELVGEVLYALAGSLSQVHAEIIVSDQDIVLCGERPRFIQIWQNLVENALKYSGEGSVPHVELGFEQRDNGVEFYVRDKGIGIKPEYQEKIFGLFEKLDSRSSGAGLGLAMVKRIVELSGGRIWVESGGVGQGACFWFTLPVAVKG